MRISILFIISFFFVLSSNAQIEDKEIWKKCIHAKHIEVNNRSINSDNFFAFYRQQLGLSHNDRFEEHRVFNDNSGFKRIKYKQFYKNIPVIGATYTLHEKAGVLKRATGNVFPHISLDINPSLLENKIEAIAPLQLEQQLINSGELDQSAELEWKTDLPQLCIIDAQWPTYSGKYKLAYEVLVKADANLPIKQKVYIDAETGEFINNFTQIIHHAVDGIAETKYYGTQVIRTDSVVPSQYVLRDYTRGDGVITYQYDREAPKDFTDPDNFWERAEDDQHQIATDAHYCATSYYDLMNDRFNWNGLDGFGHEVVCIVNYGQKYYTNAFWDGEYTYYGNGDCYRFGPLTSMDVVGHEFTHGFTSFTSGLIYKNESGALNESFSDIFGKALEYYNDLENFNWKLGHKFILAPDVLPFRSLEDPHLKNDPKYYGGKHWYKLNGDNGGVHSNSGVLNYWFYLLVEGGAGTNESEIDFDVEPIGMDKAIQIAFGMQVGYLTENSTYIDAMYTSLLYAEDLFGIDSDEYKSVLEAWKAVGLFPGFNNQDLEIEVVDEFYRTCDGDDIYLSVIVRNVGTETYLQGDELELVFDQAKVEEVIETITLNQDLEVGDSVIYEFVTPFFTKGENSGTCYVELRNDDFNSLNNETTVTVSSSDLVGIEIELEDFKFYKIEECGQDSFYRYRYVIDSRGCEGIMDDSLFFEVQTDKGDFIIRNKIFWEIKPRTKYYSSFPLDGEVVQGFSEFKVRFLHADDIDQENNTVEKIIKTTNISEGYFEGFADVTNLDEFDISYNQGYVKDSIVSYRGNKMLALASTKENPNFDNCPDDEDFFEDVYFYNSSISFCADATGMEEPTFEFNLLQFVNDSFDKDIAGPYNSMVKVYLDSTDYPVIYAQEEEKIVRHSFDLPIDYQGILRIETVTLSGVKYPFVDESYTNVDAVLFDDIRLYDKAQDTKVYTEEGYLIYPNPASSFIYIENKNPERSFDIYVYDNVGRLLSKQANLSNKYWFDISHLPEGLYFFTIKEEDKIISTNKVIKAK